MSSYWRCRRCDEIGEGEAPSGHFRSGHDGHENMVPIHCGPCDSVVILPVEEYELLRSVYLERAAQADELERLRRIEGKVLAGDTVGAYDLARAVLKEDEDV